MVDTTSTKTVEDAEKRLREEIARLKLQNKPLNKYNSELTSIKNNAYFAGFGGGVIFTLCIIWLL